MTEIQMHLLQAFQDRETLNTSELHEKKIRLPIIDFFILEAVFILVNNKLICFYMYHLKWGLNINVKK